MCGIAGFWNLKCDTNADVLKGTATRMADAIITRGPDDSGVWVEAASGIALAHRRLSIIDLSKEGHQPMASTSGRYVIVFNGEIYNFRDLQKKLNCEWRGHSDTEVMLAAIEAWGIEKALQSFNGMFAFALWDRLEKTLTLARDRVGEKPLYYGWLGGELLFASECKALRQHPEFSGEINRQALAGLVQFNDVPGTLSIYDNILKLKPGTYLQIDAEGNEKHQTYWSAEAAAVHGLANPFAGSDIEAIDLLEQKLAHSVKQRMVADVPLGAFLSGGIDSSTIVALMQVQSKRPVKTFSIGFDEAGYNEAVFAKDVAAFLRTEHAELYVTPQQALDVIPKLPTLYDEPFADSSQIPTFLVSQMAREHVTVALSGDGGDELFGGYSRYMWVRMIWRVARFLPPASRKLIALMVVMAPVSQLNGVLGFVLRLMPAQHRHARAGDKLHKMAGMFAEKTPEEMYWRLVSMWHYPENIVKGIRAGIKPEVPESLMRASTAERMMYMDTVGYLADDILVKVDRAAMGVSLETRIPLLDHELIEFAWQVPLSMKIREGKGKWLLRQVLYRHVPPHLIERPKAGFAVPIDVWLRGPLRDWAESLLDEKRLKQEGFFNYKPIRKCWKEHLSGRRNWQYHLWGVLMFQAWKEAQES